MPVKAPVVQAAAYNWSGFYVGVHAGYAWGDSCPAAERRTIDHEPTGGLFGGQIGYNWQVNNIVFGVEADLAFSTIKGDDSPRLGVVHDQRRQRHEYLGTARAGTASAQHRILFYETGGFAYGRRFTAHAQRRACRSRARTRSTSRAGPWAVASKWG